MSTRIFRVRSNLSRQIAAPGGQSVTTALAKSNSALEEHRDQAMAAIDIALENLEEHAELALPGSEGETYRLAEHILDLAGYFDTGPFYRAVYSLCDLADRMPASEWDWASVKVHCHASRLIFSAGCRDDATSAALLQGLAAIVRKLDRSATQESTN